MNITRTALLVAALSMACAVSAQHIPPPGMEVILKFDQPVSSRTAKAGDQVRLEVVSSATWDGHPVLPVGTPVIGTIRAVDKSDRFGKNARIRLVLDTVSGIPLQPRDKGKPFIGASTDHAAELAGAGAIVLGPLGLAAGYFVAGKSVNIHPGDHLRTEVAAPG